MDLLRELVDGDVGGGADENLAGVHLGEVVDDRSGRDCLSGSGRSLASRMLRLSVVPKVEKKKVHEPG